jgi:hypothetical protein
MSDAALVGRLTAYGLRGLARNPRVLIFTIVFPVVLLVLFRLGLRRLGRRDRDRRRADPDGRLRHGRDRRLLHHCVIAAQVLRSVALVAAMTLVLFLIGGLAYDVEVTGEGALGIVVSVLLDTAIFAALGVALTAVTAERRGGVHDRALRRRPARLHLRRLDPCRHPAGLVRGGRPGLPARPPRRVAAARRRRAVARHRPDGRERRRHGPLGHRGPRDRRPRLSLGAQSHRG